MTVDPLEVDMSQAGYDYRLGRIGEMYRSARKAGDVERCQDLWTTFKLLREGEREYQWAEQPVSV